ncbi:conserved hypothetical protein [Histoplasma capsulatum G186AR]|uniref:Alpha/beta hydrolase fold-3 domain-containing protein n=1 Tax=Ajellomyces capsulatus (strain G186AR / H82 / ATCC MYA-2454 / RMSCC 2432) TaxID=447093 RepID=C0NRT0_AJECG|nr:uncharacterized protein HCBG_05860 [Histoplasma capsulatum G186AR]EEH05596.1 conserved hypothetical protein [Histoplasma capsulatum G186AR]
MAALLQCIRPIYDALFCPGLPFKYRWRLLALAPINALAYSFKWLPWVFSRSYSVVRLPLARSPGRSSRALIFTPESSSRSLRPLHIHVHGGGFIGGVPELDNAFCKRMVEETGAVVASISYRLAPRYPFPMAHQDAQDAAAYIMEHAERLWGANPKLLTLSGCSVGSNLALAISQGLADSNTPARGALMIDNPVDLRIPPWEKPRPPGFPKSDPLAFIVPLFDVYAESARSRRSDDPLLNPILADIRTLPRKMLFIIAGADILLHEVTTFVDRLKKDAVVLNSQRDSSADSDSTSYEIEGMVFDNMLHGWLDLPSFIIDENLRTQALDASYDFIRRIHAENGWHNDKRTKKET